MGGIDHLAYRLEGWCGSPERVHCDRCLRDPVKILGLMIDGERHTSPPVMAGCISATVPTSKSLPFEHDYGRYR